MVDFWLIFGALFSLQNVNAMNVRRDGKSPNRDPAKVRTLLEIEELEIFNFLTKLTL